VQQTAINQAADWQAQLLKEDGSQFSIIFDHQVQGQVEWQLTGFSG
jgi:UDP-N-acetylmuramate: L-alanyl-gamma-D-glutamyl-meso-diaminopimelate ligase